MRCHMLPCSFFFFDESGCNIHGGSDFFTVLLALLTAHCTASNKTGGAEKPSAENRTRTEAAGFRREQNENRLSDLLGQLAIADLSQCHRIHPGEMTLDQLSESRFRAAFDILLNQFPIGHRA